MLPNVGLALAICEQGDIAVKRKKQKPEQWAEFLELCISEVLMANEVVKLKSAKDKDLFRCDSCKENVTDVSSMFKLHLIVKDETADIKFMLLDTVAEKLIGISAETLLDGSLDEMEDPTILHDAIKGLVGKTFQFGVLVNKDNVFYGSEIYKIGKTWSIDEVLKIEEGSEPLNPFDSAISSEQPKTEVDLDDIQLGY